MATMDLVFVAGIVAVIAATTANAMAMVKKVDCVGDCMHHEMMEKKVTVLCAHAINLLRLLFLIP